MPLVRLVALFLTLALAGAQLSYGQDGTAKKIGGEAEPTTATEATQSSIGVSLAFSHADARYKVGEPIELTVTVDKDAHLAVVSVGPSGSVAVLYPNAFQPGVLLKAGTTIEIPGKAAAAQLVASSPPGTELIRAIASPSPIDMSSLAPDLQTSAFKSIVGGAAELEAELNLLSSSSAGVTIVEKSIETVGVDNPSQNPSAKPPEIVTDRNEYRSGETVQLSVTPSEDCYLWVVDVSSDSSINVLFPNKFETVNLTPANTTAVVSGGSSKAKVVAAGGPSAEAIYALCSTSASPPWGADLDLTQVFPPVKVDSTLGKALVTVAADPAADINLPDIMSWSVLAVSITK